MKQELVPHIAITIGDINGIGPEIILKVLKEVNLSNSTPVIIAPVDVLRFYASELSMNFEFHTAETPADIRKNEVNVIPLDIPSLKINPGKQSGESGKVAMLSIEKGIDLVKEGACHALITAPISKEAVNLAGYNIPGHTEFLASKTHTADVLMMLVSGNLRVALATTHIPIHKVANAITKSLIKDKIEILRKSLKGDFDISTPKIAVFGLNPHAGDGGVIGEEEIEIISPVLDEIRKKGMEVDGPFPADGFFGQKLHEKYDAILAMYHDQGLAPFKLLSFGKGVNFTAGLPIIRTSPDHGTAFNIAGKGMADSSSFKQAYNLALQLVKQRNREA
ncbi:MAG: 4-hydroxythreonine-4-phosphate dehydrogenase PdxA [Balneolaceae bacterium]